MIFIGYLTLQKGGGATLDLADSLVILSRISSHLKNQTRKLQRGSPNHQNP